MYNIIVNFQKYFVGDGIMNVPLVLTQFLDRAVSLYGDKTAMICSGRALTYKQLNEQVNQLSHGLKQFGGRKRRSGGVFGAKYA